MSMIEQVWEKARRNRKTIVLPEGDEPRTVQAAAKVLKEGIANPVLLGDPEKIRSVAESTGTDLAGIELIDPAARGCRSTERISYAQLMNVSDAVQGMFEYD